MTELNKLLDQLYDYCEQHGVALFAVAVASDEGDPSCINLMQRRVMSMTRVPPQTLLPLIAPTVAFTVAEHDGGKLELIPDGIRLAMTAVLSQIEGTANVH